MSCFCNSKGKKGFENFGGGGAVREPFEERLYTGKRVDGVTFYCAV